MPTPTITCFHKPLFSLVTAAYVFHIYFVILRFKNLHLFLFSQAFVIFSASTCFGNPPPCLQTLPSTELFSAVQTPICRQTCCSMLKPVHLGSVANTRVQRAVKKLHVVSSGRRLLVHLRDTSLN